MRFANTPGGYQPPDLVSMLQKAIRRNRPDLAALAFNELQQAGLRNWAWNRLLTTVAEDLAPGLAVEVEALHRMDREVNRTKKKTTETRVFWSRAILIMCAAMKNRDADVLTNLVVPAVGDREAMAFLDGIEPASIPRWVYDVHTQRGRRAGKTRADFFKDEHEALEPREPGLFDHLAE